MHNVETDALSAHDLNPTVRRQISQDDLLAKVLGRAFHDEPNFTYVLPDERGRRKVLPTFFLEAIRAARIYGQIDVTPAIDRAALWICPARQLAFAQMVRTRTAAMSFKLGKGFKRYLKVASSVEEVHDRLVREPHWYLIALAMEPTQPERSIGSAVLGPGLARADSDGLLCYLETFQEAHLQFYEGHGFRIADAGCIPNGPNFWAMIRTPRLAGSVNFRTSDASG